MSDSDSYADKERYHAETILLEGYINDGCESYARLSIPDGFFLCTDDTLETMTIIFQARNSFHEKRKKFRLIPIEEEEADET